MPKRDMLINNVPGEECRIAIIEDGKLEELYHERTSIESHVGSIFKAKVTNVEPSIQAAFVDFGLERNGFLHVTDLHPRYFPGQHKEETERVGHKTPHRERPPIQKCLKRGQEILVQVIKEGLGTKGPTVTSYLSIPGRFLVMMPAMERLGVSRKVDDDEARRAMRKILDELNPPDDFGFIIRTAGMGRPKTDLKRDLAYLVRLWKNLEKKMAQPGVGELYTESDLMIRTIRDVYSADIDRIIVDEPTAAKRASDFLAIASPRAKSNVLYYEDPIPLFHRYGVEAQIETIHARRVPLPSGGSLVIDSTEALVAIDVNSGKMRNSGDAETTAYRVNVEACDEVCRQLRLRDLGGVVVIDLIDMRSSQKRRAIEQRFRDNLKRDRARTKPLAISQFGILEMTRQRMRPALTKSVYNDCHYCHGEGTVKNVDSVVMDVMRRLSLIVHRREVAKLAVVVSPDVAFPLLNRKRGELVTMEQKYNTPIQVRVNPSGAVDFIELLPIDERGNPLNVDSLKALAPPVLHAVESMPVDDLVDEETETQEMEARATIIEKIDDGVDPGQSPTPPVRETRGEPLDADDDDQSADGDGAGQTQGGAPGEGGRKRRRRRRGRRGRGEGAEGTGAQGIGDAPATGDQTQRAPDGPREGQREGQRDQRGPQQRPQQNQPQRQPQQQQPRNQPQQSRQGGPQGSQGGGQGRGGQQRDGGQQREGQPQGGQQRTQAPNVSRGYTRGEDRPKPPIIIDDDNLGNIKEDILADAGRGDGGRGNDRGEGDRHQGGGQPRLGPDGQPLKKRRRRGGRRHRRRREAQQRAEQERLAAGLPPMTDAEREDVGNRADDLAAAQGHDEGDDYDGSDTGDSAGNDREQDHRDADDNEADQDASTMIAESSRAQEAQAEHEESAAQDDEAASEGNSADDDTVDIDVDTAADKPKPRKKTTRRAPSKKKAADAKPAKVAKKTTKKVTKRPTRKPPGSK